jgi:ATP synthase in type III secretion protein N
VLLLVDSLTRFARAQREIGLACGEPPTRRSYPPSIFSMLPQLLERAGQGRQGAITAVYSVLTEGDDENDPIAEEVRSILDGHIVLSRKLAAANHFPAIDVLASVSRVMPTVAGAAHRDVAAGARSLLARYQEIELLVQIGEYQAGADAMADAALAAREPLAAFLKQGPDELPTLGASVSALGDVLDRHAGSTRP